jgi:histidinol phosphatase-like enzyme (inositol monophosphatase family)
MPPPPDNLEALDAFLVELNRASSAAILPLFRAEHGLQDKGRAGFFDPVTEADRDAEAVIRKLIGERYPRHGVIGEEYGEDRADADFVWVIDPIDGTRAFIAGLPVWTTLIGLRFRGEPVLGSIGQPYLGELFIGHAGGARLMSRGASRPLATRTGTRLSGAIIATTDPEACFTPPEYAAWRQLRAAARLARLGCDAYAYAMVAAGALDLVVEAGLRPGTSKPRSRSWPAPAVWSQTGAASRSAGGADRSPSPATAPCSTRRCRCCRRRPHRASDPSPAASASNSRQNTAWTSSVSCRISW